jgi:hypothetical protein
MMKVIVSSKQFICLTMKFIILLVKIIISPIQFIVSLLKFIMSHGFDKEPRAPRRWLATNRPKLREQF